jgi:phage baseplate assembly protein W
MADSIISSQSFGYSDLDLRFKAHPEYGDILPLKDDEAVKGSIRNILNTRPGEKPFNPEFGCALDDYLFEPNDAITRYQIGKEVERSISRFEPRIKLQEIQVSDAPDDNSFAVYVSGVLINSQREIDINILIKRFN